MRHEELRFVKSMCFAAYIVEWELLADPNKFGSDSH